MLGHVQRGGNPSAFDRVLVSEIVEKSVLYKVKMLIVHAFYFCMDEL